MARSDTDRIGVSICQESFTRMGFIFREQKVEDYGIDAIIELKNEKYASGQLIGVQIKSGASYFKESNDKAYIYRGDITHYHYWLNYCLPVIIVLVDTDESKRECYWQKIEKGLITTTNNGWKIEIPKKNELNKTADEVKKILHSQSESEKRFNTLMVSLDWMRVAKEEKELILEVNEWINKSSGRGDFKLFTLDGKVIFERTYWGFGLRDYSLVIKDLFPWADVQIDEDYYELNMDETWHEEYERQINNLNKSLVAQGRPRYKRDEEIYPYENCSGEVDRYRLKLMLNDLGNSFLVLNDFLKEGRCYFLE